MFIFKYINNVLFFMYSDIKNENDIYELLLNDNLFELYIDNKIYNHYIIYTDNFGVSYRVFIHNDLLYNDIEFFIDSFNYQNKFIILAYKKDLPMIVLFENNDNDVDKYDNYTFKEVGKITEALAPEDSYADDIDIYQYTYNQIFNYDTISLTYNGEYYIDNIGNIYTIYDKDTVQPKKIIRHYKIIKKNFINNDNQNVFFKDGTYKNYHILDINQNPNYYQDNLYQDNGNSSHNNFKDNKLNFTKYNSLEDLKQQIHNDRTLSSYNYLNSINDNIKESDFIFSINEAESNYNQLNHMYIRLAPSIDMKISQYDRILKINKLYQNLYNDEYNNKLLNNCEIPIYNDNLLYSKYKYDYLKYYLDNNDKLNK